ncbi:hypothetical protein [Planktothrix serta]|uniref:hypothetical protein n=1 Tax=Planktothrix serta TaxID=1678310 RepID=UPI0012DCC3F0|nr:hypothetical protein [Planktothrix serta]
MNYLPKQSQPIARSLNTTSPLLKSSGVSSSDFMDCYKLKGMARNICMAAY